MGFKTKILPKILDEIDKADKNGTLKWHEADDALFLTNAIQKCFQINDADSAIGLYNILMRGSNRQFFTNNLDETRFLYEFIFKYLL